MIKGMSIGTVLQVLMVVIGHFAPGLQQAGLFPIGGTLIGLLTGWLTGSAMPGAALGARAGNGAVAGGVAGALGSLVSIFLGDVPFSNIGIAGGSTLVTGAIGSLLTQFMGKK